MWKKLCTCCNDEMHSEDRGKNDKNLHSAMVDRKQVVGLQNAKRRKWKMVQKKERVDNRIEMQTGCSSAHQMFKTTT